MFSPIVHWLRDFLLNWAVEAVIKRGAGYLQRRVREWLTEWLVLPQVFVALVHLPALCERLCEELERRVRQILVALTMTGIVAAVIVLVYRATLPSRPLQAIARA